MSDFYGPALPPSFTASQSEETDKDDTTKNQGPQQPTSLRAESPHRKNASASSTVYGPALPPVSGSTGTDHDTATHTRGPGLPGNDEILENETQHEKEGSGESESGDEDCMIGPVPITQQRKEELEREQRKAGVDSRAKKMKDQLSGKVQQEPEGPRREDWMTAEESWSRLSGKEDERSAFRKGTTRT
jgi:hypothetical protein